MPVMGSNLAFRTERVHVGVMRRSEEVLGDVIKRGMSWGVRAVIVGIQGKWVKALLGVDVSEVLGLSSRFA